MFEGLGDPDGDAIAGLRTAAARAAAAEPARLDALAADLFRTPAARLSDHQRVTVLRLLDAVLAAIERPLRAALAAMPATDGATRLLLEDAAAPLARPLLDAAGVSRDGALIACLLRRVDEERLEATARAGAGPGAVVEPVADGEPHPIVLAYAAAIAARHDRFRDCAMPLADLPPDLLGRLVWATAAALRRRLRGPNMPADAIDAGIVPAAAILLERHRPADGIAARALALVQLERDDGRLDDARLTRFADDGRIALLAAALAMQAGIDPDAAWPMLLEAGGDRLALLLRAAGVARTPAAAILLRLRPHDPDRIGRQLAGWDGLGPADALAALHLWRLDPAYRAAILALGGDGVE